NHCVHAVTQAVRSVAPEASVDIDLKAGTAKIATGKSLAMEPIEPIVAAIEEKGYKIKSTQAA
ncbi:heavy-metal-associated domain-containing protein, partial [Acidithiobacillus ferriphilus]